jgi:hypothetical protein
LNFLFWIFYQASPFRRLKLTQSKTGSPSLADEIIKDFQTKKSFSFLSHPIPFFLMVIIRKFTQKSGWKNRFLEN